MAKSRQQGGDNIFALMASYSRALKSAGLGHEVKGMVAKVTKAKSYDEAVDILESYGKLKKGGALVMAKLITVKLTPQQVVDVEVALRLRKEAEEENRADGFATKRELERATAIHAKFAALRDTTNL